MNDLPKQWTDPSPHFMSDPSYENNQCVSLRAKDPNYIK